MLYVCYISLKLKKKRGNGFNFSQIVRDSCEGYLSSFTIRAKNIYELPQYQKSYIQFHSVHSVLYNSATPWTARCKASLSIINSRHMLRLMSIEPVMPFNHLILCRPLLLPPSIFLSIRVFSNEPVLHIRWPNYRSFIFSISPPDIQN